MKSPSKDNRKLHTYPIYNEECSMWCFDQPFFIIGEDKVNIISTEVIDKSKDVIHTLKTASGKVFEMKMSEIVNQFKIYNANKKKEEVIKEKQIKNNQITLNF